MKLQDAARFIDLAIDQQLAVFLHGSPGIGKSSLVKQIGEKKKRRVIDIRMTLLNPVDLRGVPVAKEGKTMWWAPAFLPHDKDDNSIIFLDELNAAPQSVQVAAYQLVLDRKCGEYVVPEGCAILAAGNKGTDRALTYDMPSALRNRFCHIEVEADFEEWKDWAMQSGIHHLVVSFLNMKPAQLFSFKPNIHKMAFPTPRSWEFVSKAMHKLSHAEAVRAFEFFRGIVGEGDATEFCAFCKVASELPNAEAVIRQGDMDIKAPTKQTDMLYAFCGALVSLVLRSEKKELEAARNLLKYAAKAFPTEFAVLCIKDYCRTQNFRSLHQKLVPTAEWKSFSEKYGSLILV